MAEKFRFKPFRRYAESSKENLEKLNSIRSVYYAYKDSEFAAKDFAVEFYHAVGDILLGKRLGDLDLAHVEFGVGSDGGDHVL